MKFAGRLVVGTVLVLLITIAVLVWTAEVSLRHDLNDYFAASLEREARLIREDLPPDVSEWYRVVNRLASESGHRITLIDRNGVVLTDSDVPADQLSTLENHRGRPEVRAALAGGTGRATRTSASVDRRLMYVAIPGGPGVVRVAADLSQVNRTVRGAQTSVLWAAFIALLIGSVLAFIAGRSIAQPLTGIAAAARAIATGNLPRFPRSGIPDVDALIRALRQMNLQLAERFDELRREQAETTAMVESMVEGVIAADGKGRVLTANEAARHLLGYGPTAPLPDLPQLFRAKAAREVVDLALAGKVVSGREIEMDGRLLTANARPLPNGGVVLVLLDLTEIRRLEAIRRDFVANVSHELKTPLTSISGYAETLISDRPDEKTTGQFLGVILSNARRMQHLVDSLLDLSRIESGRWQPRPEEISIESILKEVWDGLSQRGEPLRVERQSDIAPEAAIITVDPDALRQILTNLIENALRHMPPGGRVTCRTRVEGNEVAVSISDTGSGITREHLPRIFERFYRADASRSREEGGTGLGLAIVKHLVEAHGGRVGAESEWGKGTTITCWFPRPEPGKAAPSPLRG
jgi:two-component system phosphate regulon sensor histidine kinase PhoR